MGCHTTIGEVSSLDDDFDQMRLESGSSDCEVTDEEVDSRSWNEIESDSDEEFLEDHGLVDEVTSATEGDIILPIDCYRHFITDEIIGLMVRETNRYAEQYLQTHQVSRRSKYREWKPTTDEEMLKFFEDDSTEKSASDLSFDRDESIQGYHSSHSERKNRYGCDTKGL